MARIKLEMPESFLFSTEIKLRIGDINYGGHLANDAVLALAHEARLRFLDSYSFSEQNIYGFGLIMTDAAIVFKSEAFYGDNLLIEVAIQEINRLGFEILYRITNNITKKEVALVKTGLAFFDYAEHKIKSTPEEFQKKFT
jgi:acyl-CoA thioester hydrolase